MYQWSPEDYARHSAGQERWARERLTDLLSEALGALDGLGQIHVAMVRLQVEARKPESA